MTKSLAEQLAEKYGKPIPNASQPTLVARNPSGSPSENRLRHRGHDRISPNDLIIQTNAELCLLISKVNHQMNGGAELIALVERAVIAGKDRIYYRARPADEAALSLVFKRFVALELEDTHQETNRLLALTVIAATPHLKEQLLQFFVGLILDGHVDINAYSGSICPDDVCFVLRRFGIDREGFTARLNDERRIRTETLARQNLANRRKALQNRLTEFENLLFRSPCETTFRQESASALDIQLVRTWANRTFRSWANLHGTYESEMRQLAEDLGDLNFTRLLSARLAERCAIQYYKGQNKQVEDTSILQLRGDDNRWLTHDIEVNGHAVDVKNARRAFSSPNTYVEHCVKPKSVRRTGQEVTILGVLSDYLSAHEIQIGTPQKSCVLGEVNNSDIEHLEQWLNTHYGTLLEVDIAIDKLKFIPGWMFDYPHMLYPEALRNPSQIDALIKAWRDERLPASDFPRPLLALTDRLENDDYFGLSVDDMKLYRALRGIAAGPGINRRGLYGGILAMILWNATEDYNAEPKNIIPWLFIKKNNIPMKRHPLGCYDPLEYVWGIIHALQTMWSNDRDKLRTFSRYRLSGPGILKGFDQQSGQWITILAYCGGWRQQPQTVKCGKNPIFLGESMTCPECLHLICPECGHCSAICSTNDERQAGWIFMSHNNNPDKENPFLYY